MKTAIVFCKLVDPSTLVIDAIRMIIDFRQRLAVGKDDKIYNFVSPYQIVKFLTQHNKLPAHNKLLRDTQVKVSSPIRSVESDHSTISTFARMVELGFSGLAVIDNEKILTAISLKDISFASKDFSLLLLGVEDYIKRVRQAVISTTYYPVANVSDSDTIGSICQKFIAVKAHRLFVRRGEQLYGVLSVSDVLGAFL